jgi:ParB-like chromosome segregation protein Spo0J
MSKALFEATRGTTFVFDPKELVIITNKNNPLYDKRVEIPISRAMIDNIKKNGVIEPVVIMRDDGGRAVVVDGRQRVRCAIEAEKELGRPVMVNCVVRKGSLEDLAGVGISANEIRLDDDMLTKAEKCNRFINMGHNYADAAVAFGVSVTCINDWMKLAQAAPEVKTAVQTGIIKGSAGKEIAKLPRDKQGAAVEATTRERKATTKAAKRMVSKEQGRDATEMLSEKRVRSAIDVANDVLIPINSDICSEHKAYVAGYIEALRYVLSGNEIYSIDSISKRWK